jgi:hypothetical protein
MKKTLLFLLLPLAFLVAVSGFKLKPVNDNIVHRIAQQLHKFYTLYPQEKIYLHQDKALYSLGETIWFKAYVSHTAKDSLSTVLYTDLIGPNNTVYLSRKIKLRDGMAHGDFYLPDTLSEGNYQIRAYTNWMRNFDQAYFFTKEVTIVNPKLQEVRASVSFRTASFSDGDSVMSSLQFFRYTDEPLPNLKLKVYPILDGKKGKASSLVTNAQGIARLQHYFKSVQQNNAREAYLLVESDDTANPFSRTYRLPVGQPNLDLQFFPEGGHLVTGIASRVGFKAVNISGQGQQVAGGIYDQHGKLIVDFKSEHLGMGALKFTPEAGKTYSAKVQFENGTTATYNFPSAQPVGAVLQVIQHSEHTVNFRIENNFSGAAQRDPLYLVAHGNEKLIFAIRANTEGKVMDSSIPASRFPTGLIHFTLFDHTGAPLSQRLVYVNHPPQLNLSITTDKPEYGKREKVNMTIQATNQSGEPVAGNFSLSVHNTASGSGLHAENIYTSLHLSNELRGIVEQPAYYFDKKQPQAKHHLDLLLLTQGWRRFDWKDILEDRFPATPHEIEQGVVFSGRVDRESGKQINQKSRLTLMLWPAGGPADSSSSNLPHVVEAETNEDGSFHFSGLDFEESRHVYLQARTLKGGSNRMVRRNEVTAPAPNFRSFENSSTAIGQDYKANIERWLKVERQLLLAKGSILLNQVNVTAKKYDAYEHHRRHSKHLVDASLDFNKEKAVYGTALQYLQGRIPGVRITYIIEADSLGLNTNNGPTIKVFIRGAKEPPLFLLDGVRVDLDFISSLPMTEIELVEVIKGPHTAAYGLDGANGVLAFYSKRFNPNYDWSKDVAPGVLSFKLPGYNKPSEFYVPRYDIPEDRHNLPDYRNTLHWQHTVTTDASGKAHISFFTSDVISEFTAVCEGRATSGAVGKAEYTFNRFVQ